MDERRAVEFLKKGLNPGQVAAIVGVSPGRISQLLSKEEVKLELEAARLEAQGQNKEEEILEAKTLATKNVILDQMMKRTDEATYMDLARAYEIIARAESLKRNPIPLGGGPIFNNANVLVTMPNRVVEHTIQITKDNEVIAIGERALAPMPAARVTKLFEEMKNDHANLLTESEEGPAATFQAGQVNG